MSVEADEEEVLRVVDLGKTKGRKESKNYKFSSRAKILKVFPTPTMCSPAFAACESRTLKSLGIFGRIIRKFLTRSSLVNGLSRN